MSDEALLSSVRDVLDELPQNASVAPKFMVATWQMWAFPLFPNCLTRGQLTCWVYQFFEVQIILNVCPCVSCHQVECMRERAPGPVHPQRW